MPSCIATVPSCTLDPRMGIEVEQQHHPLSDKMKERPSGCIDNFIWFQIYSCSQISFGKYECNEIMIKTYRDRLHVKCWCMYVHSIREQANKTDNLNLLTVLSCSACLLRIVVVCACVCVKE